MPKKTIASILSVKGRIPENLIPIIGIFRAYWSSKYLGIPMCSTMSDRIEWLNMDEKSMSEMADEIVFKHGLSVYGYEGSIIDLLQNYEELRDHYCRLEIAHRRGWSYNTPEPHGYTDWFPHFIRRVQQRLSERDEYQ